MSLTDSLTDVIDGMTAAVATDPSSLAVSFRTRAAAVQDTATRVSVRACAHKFLVDEPPALGGDAAAPNPVEYALAALGSCQVITYRFWAARLGLRVDAIDVDVEGDLDLRGFFGLKDEVRPGFGAVRAQVRISGPESPERYHELTRVVDEHCPVLDLFGKPTPVKTELTVT